MVWHDGRLDFTALQHRARLCGARAEHAARKQPAHVITFDLLEVAGAVLMEQPLHQRRRALEDLFASLGLAAPWALCPQTTDAATARAWLDPVWGAAGIEGLVIKNSGSRYRPGERGWQKLRTRMSAEGIIGAVTGSARAPRSLLLGRLDAAGQLRLVARSTRLSRNAAAELGAVLRPAGYEHPWWGRKFSAGWGTKDLLAFQPVVPDLVAEVDAHTALGLGRTGIRCATCACGTTWLPATSRNDRRPLARSESRVTAVASNPGRQDARSLVMIGFSSATSRGYRCAGPAPDHHMHPRCRPWSSNAARGHGTGRWTIGWRSATATGGWRAAGPGAEARKAPEAGAAPSRTPVRRRDRAIPC
ncbi:hypothetical protein OG594_45100 [Streptomyces sp. NBC_01214]|nr:hypothetical protein [Streptomyces sp. NBC_01214]